MYMCVLFEMSEMTLNVFPFFFVFFFIKPLSVIVLNGFTNVVISLNYIELNIVSVI